MVNEHRLWSNTNVGESIICQGALLNPANAGVSLSGFSFRSAPSARGAFAPVARTPAGNARRPAICRSSELPLSPHALCAAWRRCWRRSGCRSGRLRSAPCDQARQRRARAARCATKQAPRTPRPRPWQRPGAPGFFARRHAGLLVAPLGVAVQRCASHHRTQCPPPTATSCEMLRVVMV